MQTRSPIFFRPALLVATLAGLAGTAWPASPAPLQVPARRGAVATDTPDASRAGAEVLRQGGNAVDAAIAAALALGVVAPAASGLGGGGFAVIWSARDRRARVLDFREVAPRAAERDMFVKDGVRPDASRIGGLAVAVPGEAAGLALLHHELGRLPLPRVAAPAVQLARGGFTPTARLIRSSQEATAAAADEPMLRWLRPAGRPLEAQRRVVRPRLAETLRRFGAGGADAIYRGPIAADLAATVRAHGGALTEDDLSAYRPVWREPLAGRFRGRTLYAAPPPAGGMTALEALHVLDALPAMPRGSIGGSAYLHRIAEALAHAFADRARWLGDPAFTQIPVERLASPAYGQALAARFHEDGVLPLDAYGTPTAAALAPAGDHGTSHVCVVDGEGNAVAITTTVNHELGARIEAPGSGIVLNDEMDDFAASPGKPNGFGLVGAEANAVAPGKRPASSMTPIIVVEDGQAVMCVGGSGGPTIVASVVQAIVAVLDEGVDAARAVGAPRVYAQWRPEGIAVEEDVPVDVVEGLRRRGHKILPMPGHGFAPAAQVILRHGDTIEAASDPRKGGAPAAPEERR